MGDNLEAPVIVEFDYTPKVVDVTESSQQVTVTMTVTDESGISAPIVSARSNVNDSSTGLGIATLQSGNDKDGVKKQQTPS